MLTRMWRTSPELITVATSMMLVLARATVGLALQPGLIMGAPAWLKPAKFAVSITIYTVTLAWIFTLIPEWRRTRQWIGWITAVTMVLEIAIIATQAWRGRPSHFNVATTGDAVLFMVMGSAILLQTLSTIAVAVALCRHRFDDRSLGWALRVGMCITIVGALTGGVMTRPTTAQIEAARAGERMTLAGAHTVGAPDGGPGLTGTGWSTEHGDLRIPHFVGLHALQILTLVALLLARRDLPPNRRVRRQLCGAVRDSAAGSLRGVPLVGSDRTTLTQLGVWAATTMAAAGVALLANANSGAAHGDVLRVL